MAICISLFTAICYAQKKRSGDDKKSKKDSFASSHHSTGEINQKEKGTLLAKQTRPESATDRMSDIQKPLIDHDEKVPTGKQEDSFATDSAASDSSMSDPTKTAFQNRIG